MKYLLVGLGNVGQKYDGTRHNIGFDVVDSLAEEFGVKFVNSKLAFHGDFRYKGKTIILLKPTTYMNLSGKAVKFYMEKSKIKMENLLVISDDLALPFGKLRLRGKGSHAGHNGLRDIEKMLSTSAYSRLRFGVGNQFPRGKQVEYVLGHWSKKQEEELASYINEAHLAALEFIGHGLKNTMNKIN